MRTFGNYSIKINYNRHTQLRSRYQEESFHQAGQYEKERQLSIKTFTTSDSTIRTDDWRQEIDQYEADVYDLLQKINGNPVGRIVLDKINKKTTVWIVPRAGADPSERSSAMTEPLNYDIQKNGSYGRGSGFGDTVIQFLPGMGDDSLLHELVHAYRYSYKKFQPVNIDLRFMDKPIQETTEEVLAHQMENIYLSQVNRPLTLEYHYAQTADKKTIYDFLVGNSAALQTLKSFLHHEHLAMVAAHSFSTDYNPFRDYKELESRFLSGTSLSELPELGTMLKD